MSPELDWIMGEFGEQRATVMTIMCHADPHRIDTICVSEYEPSDPKRQTFRQCMRAVLEQMNAGKEVA